MGGGVTGKAMSKKQHLSLPPHYCLLQSLPLYCISCPVSASPVFCVLWGVLVFFFLFVFKFIPASKSTLLLDFSPLASIQFLPLVSILLFSMLFLPIWSLSSACSSLQCTPSHPQSARHTFSLSLRYTCILTSGVKEMWKSTDLGQVYTTIKST